METYHQLRKERLPFKAQYDSSRVPIFTPASEETFGGVISGDNTDAIGTMGGEANGGGGGAQGWK